MGGGNRGEKIKRDRERKRERERDVGSVKNRAGRFARRSGDSSSRLDVCINIKLTRRLFTRCRGATPGRGCYRQLHAGARSRNELFREPRRSATNGKKGREGGEGRTRRNIGTVLSRRRKILSVTPPPLTEAAERGSKCQRYYADCERNCESYGRQSRWLDNVSRELPLWNGSALYRAAGVHNNCAAFPRAPTRGLGPPLRAGARYHLITFPSALANSRASVSIVFADRLADNPWESNEPTCRVGFLFLRFLWRRLTLSLFPLLPRFEAKPKLNLRAGATLIFVY